MLLKIAGWGFGLAAFAGAAHGQAQVPSTFVRQDTTGYVFYGTTRPAVFGAGNFVVVWSTYSLEPDPDNLLNRLQGAHIRPGTATTFFEVAAGDPDRRVRWPDLAAKQNGGFITTWTEFISPSVPGPHDGGEIMLQHHSATGAPLGRFQVNSYFTGSQLFSSVAQLADGSLIVVWESIGSPGNDSSGKSVLARRLPLGAVAGAAPDFQVNSTTTGDQHIPRVAGLPNGGFVIVWQDGSGVPTSKIQARRFRPNGTPDGDELQVSSQTPPLGGSPDIAISESGRMLVVWDGPSPPGGTPPSPSAIVGRWFADTGAPLGADFQVNSSLSSHYTPTVTSAGGNFLVAWTSEAANESLRARRFASDGTAVEDDFLFAAGSGPIVGGAGDGTFVVGSHLPYYTSSGFAARALPPRGDLRAGLAANWTADAGAGTMLAGGTTGTLQGASWIPGQFFSGLGFDGNDWVSFASPINFGTFADGVSVAGWVKLDLLPSALLEAQAGIYDSAVDNYALYLDRASASLRFKVTDADGTAGEVGIPESQLTPGRWHHVAGTYNATGGLLRIYLDGNQVASQGDPNLLGLVRTSPAQIAALGRNGSSDGAAPGDNDRHYFRGGIDDIAVWNRALLVEEVRFLSGNGLFADGFESGDLSAWSLALP